MLTSTVIKYLLFVKGSGTFFLWRYPTVDAGLHLKVLFSENGGLSAREVTSGRV